MHFFWVFRPCPQAHFFFTQKQKNIPLPPKKRYLWRSGWHSTVQGSRHTWTLKKNIVSHIVSFPLLNYSPFVMAVLLVVVLIIVLLSCCCCVVVIVFIYFVATLPTPPPPPPLARRRCCHCHWSAWRLTSSHCLGHQIEQRKKSGTKIHHSLRRPPNTNKNATTNHKHAGLTGKRWDMRRDWQGARGERDLIVLGQSSWDIVRITKRTNLQNKIKSFVSALDQPIANRLPWGVGY